MAKAWMPREINGSQGMIHEAMSRDARRAGEALADDAHRKMTTFARARMAGMQVAVVADFELDRLQRGAQCRLDVGSGDVPRGLHAFGADPASRASSCCR